MLLDGRHPLVDVVERPLVCHIVNKEDAHRTAVVCCRDGLKPLLARRVPYLQLDPLAIECDGTDLEVNTAGGEMWQTRVWHARAFAREGSRGWGSALWVGYPIVVMNVDEKESSANRMSMADFPTPATRAHVYG